MSQIYFGVYILPLIPHPPLLSRAPLELGGVGAVTFPPWGNSDRSRQGPLGSQAAACPHGTMPTLRCRQGREYRSSLKWGANNGSDPSCSPTPGGQSGPDRAQIHGHAGTYPLHIPAPPLSALPQPRPRAQPTLPCSLSIAPPQVCPAGRQGSRLRPTPALPLPWAGHVPERRPQATCPAPPLCRPSPAPPAA